jgi:RND family efflux transporter MFP subunit
MNRIPLFGTLLVLLLPPALQAQTPLPAAPAKKVVVPREVRLDSRVEAVQQATISAQTGGQVEELLFDIGDYVDKGSLILRLRDNEQKAQLAKAEAGLDEARANLKKSNDEAQRVKGLFSRQMASSAEMDQASSALEAAKARVDQAEAGFKQAREQLDYTQVRAPYSGIVIQRHVQVGEVAQPGKPLITGISLDRLRTLVAVPQSMVEPVRTGASARVEMPDGSQVKGTRVTVFPIADHGSNTFLVRVDLPAGVKGLFPGMFVKTAFILGEREWLAVPQQAVAYRGEVTGVYVDDGKGRLSFRHIRLGPDLGDQGIAVLSGLEVGERVALDPVEAGVLLKQQRERTDGQ